ncbi:MAG: GNAT family N-acetyltransferase [Defluviitaleaceae bacterium]|nr:GNAT family N-acetyltransferase [Defluviitaleaceae bacterium]
MINIEPITQANRPLIDNLIAENWAGPFLVTRGILHDTRQHAGFVVYKDGVVLGYALYYLADNDCEITALQSLQEKQGIGGALVKAIVEKAKNLGCGRVWLITTNDNAAAFRLGNSA